MPEPGDWDALRLPEGSEVRALLAVFPDLELLRFHDEELLIRGGEESLDIFLVLRGSCLVEHAGGPEHPGEERRAGSELAVIEGRPDAPMFAGEMAYFGGGRRTASVRSVMTTCALRLGPKHLDRIIGESPAGGFPGLTRILCRQFSERLAETSAQLRFYQDRPAMRLEQVFVSAGDTLFLEGDPADRLFQLVSGPLVQETSSGETMIVPDGPNPVFVAPGRFFRGQPHEHTVRAVRPCALLAVSHDHKLAVARNFPELVLSLLI
jgi:CRP-like cAMP-binding protein